MNTLPLQLLDGHLFVELNGARWLLDTGAPTSFGKSSIAVGGQQFTPESSYMGLTADVLSQFVGVSCAGLLGADVLGCFDHILDAGEGSLTLSTSELSHNGHNIHLDEFMGIPIVTVRIGDGDHRMFFDTGAQISYFQDDSLVNFPPAGSITDFFPGVGQFTTDTYEVPMSLGGIAFTLRCGTLPGLLGMTLMMADAEGILGSAILTGRKVGYFPRRSMLVL